MRSANVFPQIFPVTAHTDHVGAGSTFVVIQGLQHDGAIYIDIALKKGATTIVVQQDKVLSDATISVINQHKANIFRVPDTRKALAQLSAQAAGNPAQKLKLFAVTGTKGKSTTVFLLEHILRTAGFSTALLSTVKNTIGDTEFAAPLTTAQPDYLHQFFALCVERGVTHVVMEVAAQALTLHRVEGLLFDGVIFTNFSREHLEFYASLDEYFSAKQSLFLQTKHDAPWVINADDGRLNALEYKKDVVSFGYQYTEANFSVQHAIHTKGIEMMVQEPDGVWVTYVCPVLFGHYNGYNMLGAITLARTLGVTSAVCADALAHFAGVTGRLEQHRLPNGALCIIDCAHNPASYQALLSTLRPLTPHLIVVFGAGGDRDPGRRPLMGALVAEFADVVMITSDNPRTEDPALIVRNITDGIVQDKHYKVIIEPDREVAIRKAYERSTAQTIIALLGKADSDYQIVGTAKIPFSERSIIRTLC